MSFINQMDGIQAPYQSHSEPSSHAAESIQEQTPTLRAKVFKCILQAGSHGHTDEEIQFSLDINPNSERPRRIELVRLGMIRDSGKQRQTISGRKAAVWIAIMPGEQLTLL